MKQYVILASAVLFSSNSSAISIDNIEISEMPDDDGYYTVSIVGAEFGSGPNIVLYDDFNNHKVGSDASLDGPLIGEWDSYGVWSGKPEVVQVAENRGVSVRDQSFPLSSGNRMAQLEKRFESVNEIFFSFSVFVPEENYFSGSAIRNSFPEVSSWKFSWLLDGADSTGKDGRFDLCVPTHVGNGRFLLAGNDGSLGGVPSQSAWSWTDKNHFSFGLSKSSDEDLKGHMVFKHTGSVGQSYIDERKADAVMFDGVSKSFDRVRFPGWWGNGHQENFDAIYDDFYIAIGPHSFARVELTDSKETSNATLARPMPVVRWEDSSVVIKVHKEYIETGNRYFVNIHDSENESRMFGSPLPCKLCPKM